MASRPPGKGLPERVEGSTPLASAMKTLRMLLVLLVVGCSSTAVGQQPLRSFEGKWVTNQGRQLNGIMICDVVKYDGGNREWTGRFHGTWHGQRFSYTVKWKGPVRNMRGKATIDGAAYDWAGSFTKDKQGGPIRFYGTFLSHRYGGWFDLYER